MSDILARMQAVHEGRKAKKVPVPEYGFDLYFTPLTVADRSRIRKGVDPSDDDELTIKTLIQKACDKDGKPVFEDDGATRKVLYQMDMNILRRILEEAEDAPDEGSAKND